VKDITQELFADHTFNGGRKCPLLAQSKHGLLHRKCPLSVVKRMRRKHALLTGRFESSAAGGQEGFLSASE
jgi:hypothetical protein